MRYWVYAADGQKYGPVELAELQQWIDQGRIVRHTTLEDEASGVRMAANAITELRFPERIEATQPWLAMSFGMAVFALTCCCWGPLSATMAGGGIWTGVLAFRAGHRWGILAIALNVIALGLWAWHPFPSVSPDQIQNWAKNIGVSTKSSAGGPPHK